MEETRPPAGPQVLLVEDAEEISSLLEYLLQRAGFRVTVARDGRQAVDRIERDPPPDLVLLDILLPYFSGFDLVERIRASGAWARVPIVMLTAKSQEKDIVRALDLGANDYIVKPFQPNEVIARLRRFLRSHGSATGAKGPA